MFSPEEYTIICAWLPRLLGAIYLFAFWPFLFQMRGLLGNKGILPVSDYLAWIRRLCPKSWFRVCPTLFWLRSDDRALIAVVVAGIACSILLILGLLPSLMLLFCWILYCSIISIGQDFLSFGWELFLQEVALNIFLVSLSPTPNIMVWLSINFLLFRFYLQSGAVKLQSRDPSWRNLTAVAYHYESQPIANLTAWYVHKLPMWFHKCSCVIMYIIEMVVPFLLFFTEDMRLVACALFLSLQFFIYATGNFSYLNHLSAVFSLLPLNNRVLHAFGFSLPEQASSPEVVEYALTVAGSVLLVLQALRLWNHFWPTRALHSFFNALGSCHIVNRYGIFAVMTCRRFEVVIEGSDEGIAWKEYDFYHKPTDLKRRPRRISPYQPRLDWQAWFLPFHNCSDQRWFQNFLAHLLQGTPEVLSLLRYNPFPDKPPQYVRALMYVYSFTTFEEKEKTGAWWKREYVGFYSPVFNLIKKPDSL
ncbi:MAG: lipase maturation factor family protein [Verrucomicrobia bacterium]|nr:lipase maturation factor family protein [Verrucomicrobiota bacterium]